MARLWDDNASSTLASGLAVIDTTLTVQTGHGARFPTVAGSDYFKATLTDSAGNIEIVKVSAHTASADSMTIVRAQDGTTALVWVPGDVVSLRPTASAFTAYEAHIDATAAAHAAAAISYAGSTNLAATTVEAALDELDSEKAAAADLTAHLNDAADAHDATAISYAGGTGSTATDVEGALDELYTAAAASTSSLTAHLNDTVDAHDASAISYVGGTGMSATDVESAIDELATEKANDADVVKKATTSTLTVGYATTPGNLGTKSSGTQTPSEVNGGMQYYSNAGAHTLAPPANYTSLIVDITNATGAGAITTSGFTKVSGDSFTVTVGDKFRCYVSKGNIGSHLHVVKW